MATAAAADIPWRLETKTARHRDGQTATFYSLHFSPAMWERDAARPSFSAAAQAPKATSRAQLARQAYEAALIQHTSGKIKHLPAHVHLMIVSRIMAGSSARISIPVSVLPAATSTANWIYVVEEIDAMRTMHCAGGMLRTDFERRAGRRGVIATIARVACDPTGFYDASEIERESSLPSIPETLSEPQNAMLLSSSSSLGAEAASPLLDYAGTRVPEELDAARAVVSALMPLRTLMRDHFQDMQNVARFERSNPITATTAAAHGGTANQRFEVSSIAMFANIADAALHRTAHVVVHWLVRQHILGELVRDDPTWKWFAEREASLVALHVRLSAPGDSDLGTLLHLIRPVVSYFGMVSVDDSAIPAGATRAASSSRGVPGDACWFAMDAVDALVLGMPSMAAGAQVMFIDPATHMAYFTVTQVADDLVPFFIQACIEGKVDHAREGRATASASILDEEEACCGDSDLDLTAPDNDDDVRAEAKSIIQDRIDEVSGALAGLHLPRTNVDQRTLPHIENTSAVNALYPLCIQRLRRKLMVTNHLKFGERFEYTSFLLDIGYTKAIVNAHLEKHMTAVTSLSSKYHNLATRQEIGLWKDGFRTIPYGMACNRKISGKDLPGDVAARDETMCIGCPYARLSGQTLRSELAAGGIDDVEDIVVLARVDSNPRGACAQHFRTLFNHLPNDRFSHGAWRPRAPRAFFKEAISCIQSDKS